jgi:RNA polymerase sigma-70 factor, ECF subfamily
MSIEELIRACGDGGNTAAWEEFIRRFHSLIAGVVVATSRRWGVSSPSLADDLIQETYLRLCRDRCRLLREFQAEHPEAFFGYLKVIAVNVVHDYFRARYSKKRGYTVTEEGIEGLAELASGTGTPAGIERAILLEEIDTILLRLSGGEPPRDRAIFWLYYRQGFTADAIAALPAVRLTVKGVESVIHRLTRTVRESLVNRELGKAGSARDGRTMTVLAR